MSQGKTAIFGRTRHLGMIALTLFVVGCKTIHSPVGDVYSGYKTLEPPRAEFAVGAAWIPTLDATNGAGLPSTSLSSSATSDIKLTNGLKLDIGAVLTKYLGFSGSDKKNIDVTISDAEIVSVKDLSDLQLAGSSRTFIHSAVRVKRFTILADSSQNLEVRNAVLKRLNLVDGNLTVTPTGRTEVTGANLYVAYKTVEASRLKTSAKRLSVSYDTKEKVSLDGFTLSAWSRFTYPCSEGPRVYWLVQSDSIVEGATTLRRSGHVTLSKQPSQQYQSTPSKKLFDVSSDAVISVYKGLDGNVVRQAQLRFAYDGMEVIDDNNGQAHCRQVSGGSDKGTVELVVFEYTLGTN